MSGSHRVYWREKRRVLGLLENPEEKRPLGRRRNRWENNIKMDLQEVECRLMDWKEIAHDRDTCWALVNTAIKFRCP